MQLISSGSNPFQTSPRFGFVQTPTQVAASRLVTTGDIPQQTFQPATQFADAATYTLSPPSERLMPIVDEPNGDAFEPSVKAPPQSKETTSESPLPEVVEEKINHRSVMKAKALFGDPLVGIVTALLMGARQPKIFAALVGFDMMFGAMEATLIHHIMKHPDKPLFAKILSLSSKGTRNKFTAKEAKGKSIAELDKALAPLSGLVTFFTAAATYGLGVVLEKKFHSQLVHETAEQMIQRGGVLKLLGKVKQPFEKLLMHIPAGIRNSPFAKFMTTIVITGLGLGYIEGQVAKFLTTRDRERTLGKLMLKYH